MNKLVLLTLPLALLLGCKKDDPDPASQLPPATQTGANTFGCLLNGQPWTPNGNNGVPNLIATYDPGYLGGALQIKAYRLIGPDKNVLQGLTFGASRVARTGNYDFVLKGENGANYTDSGLPPACNYYGESPRLTYRKGQLTITRLDLQAGIVSGTFAFTLYQPGCDSVRVTQGRFDKKL